jgi:lipopolysaccharide transport system ATP-binding protein
VAEISDDLLVSVENVSKRFCRSLKRSLWTGLQDLGSEIGGSRRLPQCSADVQLRPDEFWALKDVSFELRRGECLGLIGRNGAGKTTLLKMLNGLIKPDTGKIMMRGRIGALIALGAGFNPILTGRENIYTNASILGLSQKEIDSKINEIIGFAEIGRFIDSPVQNYSSGMQVRLGFSIASTISPDVLILDEVLAVGDIGFVIKCLNRVKELSNEAAVILVTHNMQSVSWFCTRVMLMEDGHAELDTHDTSTGIDRYFSLAGNQVHLSGLGGVTVNAMGIRSAAAKPFTTEEIFSHGAEAFVDLAFTVDVEDELVAVVVAIDDASASQVICFPMVDANEADKQFGKGKHSVTIPVGKLELNSGKYSLLAWATGTKTRRQFARSAGNSPFRVITPKHLWTKLIRPLKPHIHIH